MTQDFEPDNEHLMGFYEIPADRRELSPLVGMWFTYRDDEDERQSGRIVDKVGYTMDHTDAVFVVELFAVTPGGTIPEMMLHVVRFDEIIDRPWKLYRSMKLLADNL